MKLIELSVQDINKDNIYTIQDNLQSIDSSDYGYEREDALDNLIDICQNAVESFENNDLEEIQSEFNSLRDSLVQDVANTQTFTCIQDMQDYIDDVRNSFEDIETFINDLEPEDNDYVQDLVDANADYQDEFGGLGRIYIK